MPAPLPPTLSPSTIDDLLYAARTGDLADLISLTSTLTSNTAQEADIYTLCIDPETGNTLVHMAAANNHVSILEHILPAFSGANSDADADSQSSFINRQNEAGNTAVHYAAMNGQLDAVKVLVERGRADVRVVNRAGRDALGEAEIGEKEDVAEFLARLGVARSGDDANANANATAADGDEGGVKMEDGVEDVKVGNGVLEDEAEGEGKEEELVDEMRSATLK